MLHRCQQDGLSTTERGSALEALVSEAFSAIPGVLVRARNAKSVFQNEEFDLVMSNRAHPEGVESAGPLFSVECKNWTRPVGAMEVAWFATKLRRSGQRLGILVAAKGVTGRAADLTAAHYEAAAALGEGQAVIILTLAELAWVSSGEHLAVLLGEKHGCLVARREIRIFDEPNALSAALRPGTHPPSQSRREELIAELVAEVDSSPIQVGSVAATVADLWSTIKAFSELHGGDPTASELTQEEFDQWIDREFVAFENVQNALKRLGRTCVATLRRSPGSSWPTARLLLGVELRAPTNLDAPPDSRIGRMLVDHWTEVTQTGPSYRRDPALLCLLGWSIEWLAGIEDERWPPPSM